MAAMKGEIFVDHAPIPAAINAEFTGKHTTDNRLRRSDVTRIGKGPA